MSSIAQMYVAMTTTATAASTTTTTAATMKMTTTTTSYIATTCATTTTTTPITSRIVAATATAPAPAPMAVAALPSLPPTRTTITSDPGILCFHHCNVKVFCFTLPHICPNCKAKLDTTGEDGDGDEDEHENEAENTNNDEALNDEIDGESFSGKTSRQRNGGNGLPATKVLLPFRLPYPFVRASQYPCAIVLRPTTGDFLNDYNNATDLHIAVTTSTGTVVEFDRHGLRQHRTENMPEWWQCLLVGDVPEPWYDYWDDILLQLCKQTNRWSIAAYHEDTHNCYTFVLAFLQALAYDKLSEAAHSKTTFCEKYIVPRTTTAGKYISLYRKLRDTGGGLYVHPYISKRHHHQRSKLRGYINSSALTAASTAKKLPKALNSTASSIMPRSPALCTIEE